MVFGIFTRKPTTAGDESPASPELRKNGPLPDSRLPTPTPSTVSVAASARQSPLRFPTSLRAVFGGSTSNLAFPRDSDMSIDAYGEGSTMVGSPAPPPPVTPSPPPPSVDSKALYELMLTIPPKTLHAYALAHLLPRTPQPSGSNLPTDAPESGPPPSPETLGKLTKFFSTLAPPPLLHCVRCHVDFYAIENEEKDKACRVPHDDESALVSRVPGGGYETLWGCCGQTVGGDGAEGPPDGWCYEGRHTTDMRRARFRADSTIHNDKLTSCLKLNCHGVRDQLPRPSVTHSQSSPVRRPERSPVRPLGAPSVGQVPAQSLKGASSTFEDGENEIERGRARKGTAQHKKNASARSIDNTDMTIADTSRRVKINPEPRPASRARPPNNTSTTSLPADAILLPSSKPISVASAGSTATQRPRSSPTKPKTASRSVLSRSHTQIGSDSDTSSRARPRTRSSVREQSGVRNSSRPRRVRKPVPEVVLALENRRGVGTDTDGRDDPGDDARGRKKRRTG